ncbi:DUF4352 domain-containing protein [Actinoplanes sp. NPDC026619]|uniref:DUF4352 domain-containing protein n=1 Tax=Actinoplanes sp. NPDC026619 TaxID=3155798 RepID=UPI0033CDC9B3
MTNRTTMSSSPSVKSPAARHRRGRTIAVTTVVLLAAAAAAGYATGFGRSLFGGDDRPGPVAAGAVARDGTFEFVVSGVKCGTKTVGTGTAAVTAQGVYCLVGVQVTNRGGGTQHLDGAAQKLYDAGGTQYVGDSGADRQANAEAWSGPIAPGATLTGRLVFDVLEATKPTEIELHETLLSPGVRVTLR